MIIEKKETRHPKTGSKLQNVEWFNCVVEDCGKPFMRRTKRKKLGRLPPEVRKFGSKTCSSKCSRRRKWKPENLNKN